MYNVKDKIVHILKETECIIQGSVLATHRFHVGTFDVQDISSRVSYEIKLAHYDPDYEVITI